MALRVAGQSALSARLTFPLRGAWTAELELGSAANYQALERQVTLELPGGVELVGTVLRSGLHAGRGEAHIVGGAGGLQTVLVPRQYRDATVGAVLDQMLREGGETLSSTADQTTLEQYLLVWTTPGLPLAQALDELCAVLEISWRVLDDGSVWVGTNTWPERDAPFRPPWQTEAEGDIYRVTSRKPGAQVVEIAPDIPSIRPGVTFEGGQLSSIVYVFDPGRVRAHCYLGEGRGTDDQLRRIVREALAAHQLRRATYPAEVVSQDADGTLQVLPDDPDIPPMTGVPLRTGVPGLEVEVLPGARVQIAFEAGDPRRPIAMPAFDGQPDKLDTLRITGQTEIEVNAPTVRVADNGGELLVGDAPANQFARVGDIVNVAAVILVPDPTKGIVLTSPVGPVTGTIGTPAIPCILVGQIISGCPQGKG